MTTPKHSRLLILGAGPAGYTAAVYAARAKLKPTMIIGVQQGGTSVATMDVGNWMGDVNGLHIPVLLQHMKDHVARFEAEIVFDRIRIVDLKQHPLFLKGDSGEYTCDALIFATGATAKCLGISNDHSYNGSGVSACATCDGLFFRDKDVVVVGGGNTAAEETLYLSNICRKVYLVDRGDKLRAGKIMHDKLFASSEAGKIEVVSHHTLEEVLGDQSGITGVRIKSTSCGAIRNIDATGFFLAIGDAPNSGIFEGQLGMRDGYLKIRTCLEGMATMTSIPGVFAASDVADHVCRQAVTSAGFGCMAALDAERWLDQRG
jgi:thioredoxin reductase (NADPH)